MTSINIGAIFYQELIICLCNKRRVIPTSHLKSNLTTINSHILIADPRKSY